MHDDFISYDNVNELLYVFPCLQRYPYEEDNFYRIMIVILNYFWETKSEFENLMNSYIGYYNTYLYLFEKYELRLLSMDEEGNVICSECNLNCRCECEILKPNNIYSEVEGCHLLYNKKDSIEILSGDYVYPICVYDWYTLQDLFPEPDVMDDMPTELPTLDTESTTVDCEVPIDNVELAPQIKLSAKELSPLGECKNEYKYSRNVSSEKVSSYYILRRLVCWTTHYSEVIKWRPTTHVARK